MKTSIQVTLLAVISVPWCSPSFRMWLLWAGTSPALFTAVLSDWCSVNTCKWISFALTLNTRIKKRKELKKLGASTAGASSWLAASTKIQEEWGLELSIHSGTVQLTGSGREESEVLAKSHSTGFSFFLFFWAWEVKGETGSSGSVT